MAAGVIDLPNRGRRALLAVALGVSFGLTPASRQAHAQIPPDPVPTPTPTPVPGLASPGESPLSGAFGNLGVSAPAAPAPTEKVAAITVRGGKTVSAETVGFYLGVKAGDGYDPAVLRRNFIRLWESGLFEDLRLEREDGPAGVTIVAVVVERPKLADLEFRGNKKLTTSQLKDKLKEGKAEIRVGGPLSLRDVSKAKAALIEAYRAEGFRSVAVDTTIETMGENERRVVFLVDEGDKVKIQSISFGGNTVFKAGRMRRAMKKTHETHWYKFWDSKDVYTQATFEEDMESLRQLYQDKGYKDIVVKDPVIDTFVTNPKEKRPEKVKRRANIKIPVVEGERFFLGDLTVDGATIVDPKLIQRFFYIRKGQPLSRAAIQDGLKATDSVYRSKGYIYVFMNPEYAEKPDHVVDVAVKVTEGDQYRLGRIEFIGNKTTRDKVLRRELLLNEGDIMDMESFKKGLYKVTQLGYFKVEEDPDFRVNAEKKTVDVTVKGQDTNRNEVQFGAGYSQLDGLFGQFQFNTRNFLGRGDTIGVQFQRGNRTNYFDLSYGSPYFLDKRMSVGGSIFNRTIQYSDVDQRSRGVNLSYGLQLGIFDALSAFYGFTDTKSRYQVFPPPAPPGGGFPPNAFADYSGTTSAITPGYRFDSRNDPFDPTRGKRYGISVTFAGGVLGGDFSFVKPTANFTWYIPTGRRSTLAFNAEYGMVRPYAGGGIPLYERFRIGGDRSIRGFQFGAVFPLDSKDQAYFDQNGALLGGDKFGVVNFEFAYAVAGPLKVVGFFDAGNAWIEGVGPNFDLRYSAGLELRVFLPIFQAPLRFIYAINLSPKVVKDQRGLTLQNGEEKKTDFQFSIGSTF